MGQVERDLTIFSRRRKQFLKELEQGVAFFPAAPEQTRSNDVDHPFRQDSDFYYLTGFREPEAVAVLQAGSRKPSFVLFVRPCDPDRELWTGRRAGVEGACAMYGADEAYPIGELDARLPALLEGAEDVYLAFGKHPEFDGRINSIINRQRRESRRGVRAPAGLVDVREILHEMRLHKTPADLKRVRRAAAISCAAHLAAMRACRPGMYEYELAALIEYVFRKNGGSGPGYPTIVGAAENGTILHYVENDCRMENGDLVLIDAGAEFDFFTGDITRTFPVGGRFSPAQREIYELVLAAQRAAIRAVAPGATTKRVHDAAVRVIVRGLRDLGILKGELKALIKEGAHRRFFMHGTSHWLGMDVHDVGRYRDGKIWRVLELGMVLTVEPGIYIPAAAKGVPRRYRGIAVRIEDDVLVTPTGRENLTAAAPKEVAEIEAAMTESLQIPV